MPRYVIGLHLPQYSVLLSRDLGSGIWPNRRKRLSNAKFYQKALIESSTCWRVWDLRKYPHSQFFGMQSCIDPTEVTGKGHWLLNEGFSKHKSTWSGAHVNVKRSLHSRVIGIGESNVSADSQPISLKCRWVYKDSHEKFDLLVQLVKRHIEVHWEDLRKVWACRGG